MKPVFALLILLSLAGCGGRIKLAPKPGHVLPAKSETGAQAPTPEQMMTPDSQSRPKRSDEQLLRSEERREDKFDLPPTR